MGHQDRDDGERGRDKICPLLHLNGTVGDSLKLIGWLSQQDPSTVWEIKEHHEKRSLSANAYAWALIGKIADVLRKSKEDVYFQMLKDYGQSEFVSVLSDIDVHGYFKYYEEYGNGRVQGKDFTHYKVYKGSSEYDSKEMSILIDGIIQEARNIGIETITPAEKELMIQQMRLKE